MSQAQVKFGSHTAKPKRRFGLFKFIVFAVLVYAAGFFFFVFSLPPTVAQPRHADGIVALTGGEARVDSAEQLLERGVGKRLLISGVDPATTKADLKRIVHGGQRFDCCTDLGFRATDTHGNAEETAAWARAHGYKSLVIVTASYHMPRSLNEFGSAMPGVRLEPYPVEPQGIDFGRWWQDPRALRLLQGEYVKYLASLVANALQSGPDQPPLDRRVSRRNSGHAS